MSLFSAVANFLDGSSGSSEDRAPADDRPYMKGFSPSEWEKNGGVAPQKDDDDDDDD